MRNSHSISAAPSSRETVSGLVYLALQLFVLPSLLHWVNGRLSRPMGNAELNFVFYLTNFMMMLLIFHEYLGRNLKQVGQHPVVFCEAVILGLVGYYALSHVTVALIGLLAPGFSNYNDEAIAAMSRANSFVMIIGTVVLVPPFEECIYRGLIFRNLYGKNRPLAYIVSIVLFSVIHILGYIGKYSPLELLMAVLQYLPAGFCLAWSYVRGETIFAPIAIHAAINYITIRGLR